MASVYLGSQKLNKNRIQEGGNPQAPFNDGRQVSDGDQGAGDQGWYEHAPNRHAKTLSWHLLASLPRRNPILAGA